MHKEIDGVTKRGFLRNTAAFVLPIFAFGIAGNSLAAAAKKASKEKIERFAIRIKGNDANVHFLMVPKEGQFPDGSTGLDISIDGLPELRYRLLGADVELKKTDGTPQRTYLAWGVDLPGVVNWDNLQDAFKTEMRKTVPRGGAGSNSVEVGKRGGILPGSIIAKLSSEDLENFGTVSGIIFAFTGGEVIALAAVAAGTLILLDDLTGKTGLLLEFNPFIGMGFVVPRGAEQAIKKVIVDMPVEALGRGVDNVGSLIDDISSRRITADTVVTAMFPISAFGPPQIREEFKKLLTTPGKSLKDAPKNFEREVRKVSKRLPKVKIKW